MIVISPTFLCLKKVNHFASTVQTEISLSGVVQDQYSERYETSTDPTLTSNVHRVLSTVYIQARVLKKTNQNVALIFVSNLDSVIKQTEFCRKQPTFSTEWANN